MKSLSNGGDRVPIGHLLSLKKLPVLVLGYIQLSCWPKGSQENPKQPMLLPRLLSTNLAPLVKTTPVQLIEYGEVELVPT